MPYNIYMYKFITSSTDKDNWLIGHKKEVCFIGRSNVGKSTLVNALSNQKQLARTSNTPGRTQLINFFQDNDKHTLVDLPGYGFAKIPMNIKEKMIHMIEEYFIDRKELVKTFVLIDSKVGPTTDDVLMLESLQAMNRKYIIVLTKADKTTQSEIHKTTQKIKKITDDFIVISSTKGTNIQKLKRMINAQF